MDQFFGSFAPSPLSSAVYLALLVLGFGLPIALGWLVHRQGGNGLVWGAVAFVLGPVGWLITAVRLQSRKTPIEI